MFRHSSWQTATGNAAAVKERGTMKILALQSGTRIGGTELMAFSTLSRFDHRNFEITVCFLCREGPLSDLYRAQGIKVLHLGNGVSFASTWRLWKFLTRTHFDLIEIYGLRVNVIGRLIGRLTGHRRMVTLQRSVDTWRRFWHIWLDRLTSRWITLYVSNTQAAANRLQATEKIHPSKIKVIENGINTSAFDQTKKGLVRAELAIELTRPVVTCVANFKEVKGHRFLIDAIDAIRNQYPNICLWLVGDGPLRPEIERQVNRLKLENVVMILGQRSDIPEILADTDIFVLTSLWEGMPNAVLEAMAGQLPVVATRVGGIPEMIVDGESGYLVPPGDPTAIVDALASLLDDPKHRHEMGNAGYLRVRSYFNIDAKVREFENTYQALINTLGTKVAN